MTDIEDLIRRLELADQEFSAIKSTTKSEALRLAGKRQGVRLAISYAAEYEAL